MDFEDDIFLSYAHVDDRPLDDVKGWVTSLHERLKDRLAMLLGAEPKIWWDQRQQGNQYLVGMIGDRVSNTLLMISVVTPRYVNSEWCRAEVREFCARADRTGGILLGNQPRVFKVVKTPFGPAQEPPELGGLLSYDFYEMDANDSLREFRQEIGANKDLKYWAKFEDLAQDIKKALETARPQRAPAAAVGAAGDEPLGKKVYLAETTSDLRDERDRIKRELLQRGYYVLPDRDLPLTAPDFEEAVRGHLERSALSVHLIGASYGIVPEGEEERSIVRWQSELAAARGGDAGGVARLVWMPPGLKATGARQQAFVSSLRERPDAGAELLETSLEDLKTRILEKLNPPAKPKPPPGADAAAAEGAGAPTSVYLIHDNRDQEGIKPLDDYLWEQGYEVIKSVGEGEESLVAQYHRDNLLECDATLIYYGQGNELWLRSKLWDLRKAAGWGRTRPMKAKAVYVSAPASSAKQSFRTREVPLVLHNLEGFSPAALRPFVEALGGANGGQK